PNLLGSSKNSGYIADPVSFNTANLANSLKMGADWGMNTTGRSCLDISVPWHRNSLATLHSAGKSVQSKVPAAPGQSED
ncbi:MAG: hypothetical protein ACI9NT_001762, partial [Bacteroidia bacterium]